MVAGKPAGEILGFALILFAVAFLDRVTASDYSGIFISGESLAVSKAALLERWEAADNVQDDGMSLLLTQPALFSLRETDLRLQREKSIEVNQERKS